MTNEWERVDERVLRWLFERNFAFHEFLELEDEDPPGAYIEGLRSLEIEEGMRRLTSDGLVDAKESLSGGQIGSWHSIRVTSRGLIELGEWPDLDLVATAANVHDLLERLAEGAPGDKQSMLRRAAQVVARGSDSLLRAGAKQVGAELGDTIVGS